MNPLRLYRRIRGAISPGQETGIIGDAMKYLSILRPKNSTGGSLFHLFSSVGLLIEMIRDRSFALTWTSKVGILAGLVYFVLPADTIPDLLPLLGFIDDAAVIGFVLRAMAGEVRRYAEHKAALPQSN